MPNTGQEDLFEEDLYEEEEEEIAEEESSDDDDEGYDDSDDSYEEDDDPEIEIAGRSLRFSEIENIVSQTTNLSQRQVQQVPEYTSQLQDAGASDPQMKQFFGYIQAGYSPKQAFVAIAKQIVDQELEGQQEEQEPEFQTLREEIEYTAERKMRELKQEIANLKRAQQEQVMAQTAQYVETHNNEVLTELIEDFGLDPNEVMNDRALLSDIRQAFVEAFSTPQQKADAKVLMRSVPLTKRQMRMVIADALYSRQAKSEYRKSSRTNAVRKLQQLPKSVGARSNSKQGGTPVRKVDGVSMTERARRVNELFD